MSSESNWPPGRCNCCGGELTTEWRELACQLVGWLLYQFAEGHGCLSGECSHERDEDCITILVDTFERAA